MLSEDLHPSRWSRTRPFARHALDIVKRTSVGGAPTERTLQDVIECMRPAYNDAILRVPFERRPANGRPLMHDMAMCIHAAAWHLGGRQAFVLTDGLFDALRHASLSGVRAGDLKMPYSSFYVCLAGRYDAGLPGPDNAIDGAYVRCLADSAEIVVTTRLRDRSSDAPKGWPFRMEPYFYAPLSLADDEATFEELLDDAVASGEIDLEGTTFPEEGNSGTYTGENQRRVEYVDTSGRRDREDARDRREAMPLVREVLGVVVNAIAWVTGEPADLAVEPTWPDDTPSELVGRSKSSRKTLRRRAEADLLNGAFSRVRILGREVERSIREASATGAPITTSHWRIGHWRLQPHGERNSLRKVRWIRPVWVRSDLGEPFAGRISLVGPPGT